LLCGRKNSGRHSGRNDCENKKETNQKSFQPIPPLTGIEPRLPPRLHLSGLEARLAPLARTAVSVYRERTAPAF
jgi:hypothetical protein